jgi:hypothetical protein
MISGRRVSSSVAVACTIQVGAVAILLLILEMLRTVRLGWLPLARHSYQLLGWDGCRHGTYIMCTPRVDADGR